MFENVRAVIFDLNRTLSTYSRSVESVIRMSASSAEIDLSGVSDADIMRALNVSDRWLSDYMKTHDLDIHWGSQPDHWVDANRTLFRTLGLEVPEAALRDFEHRFHEITRYGDFEYIIDDAKYVLEQLHKEKMRLALCTKRSNDPTPVLEREGVLQFFSSIQWTFVHGYAKPSPYTLILAAAEMEVNPRNCVFVGNFVWLDMVAAQRAGMIPVLTVWANPKERENATEDIIVIDSLRELLGLILGD